MIGFNLAGVKRGTALPLPRNKGGPFIPALNERGFLGRSL